MLFRAVHENESIFLHLNCRSALQCFCLLAESGAQFFMKDCYFFRQKDFFDYICVAPVE